MIVSSPLFEAYLECPTKCWLRSRGEPTTWNAYAEWACAHNVAYYKDRLKCLLAVLPESGRTIAPPISKHPKDSTWRLAIDVTLRANELESGLQALERIPPGTGEARPVHPLPFQICQQTCQRRQVVACVRRARAFRSGWMRGKPWQNYTW
jgi:hypothetical protein